MTSAVSICNLALMRLGHNPISALNEDSKAGIACNANYEPVRDALLREHYWNFSVKRVELAQDATAPAFEFAYRYALPADYLRMIRTEDESAGCYTEYRIENGYLLSDAGTVKIEYVAKITDPNSFDPTFVDVLAARLAAEICMWLTDNQSAATKLAEIAEGKLKNARTFDAMEGTPRSFEANEWLQARF